MGAVHSSSVPGFLSQASRVCWTLWIHSVDRVLDLLGLPPDDAPRWDGGK